MISNFLKFFAFFSTIYSLTTQAVPRLPKGKYFDRIVITIFENKNFQQVANTKAFSDLAKRGLLLQKHYGVAHPSFPNYLALISGETHGQSKINDQGENTDMINIKDKQHVGDLMDKKGVSWGSYLEGYPTTTRRCVTSRGQLSYVQISDTFSNIFLRKSIYVREHNPFMSFESISLNPDRCIQHLKSFKQLDHILFKDIDEFLPQFMLVIPDMDNNGHDKPLSHVGRFIKGELMPRFDNKKFGDRTLFVVTFDEDNFAKPYDNRVYTVMWGAGIKKGSVENDVRTDHYSILKMVEDNWGLGDLGKNDKTATPLPIQKYQTQALHGRPSRQGLPPRPALKKVSSPREEGNRWDSSSSPQDSPLRPPLQRAPSLQRFPREGDDDFVGDH